MESNLGIQAVAHPKTPIYQRFTAALQSDPRCSQEVALGRRIGLYRFCGDIGRGNFSRVKLAVHQLTKDKVAIKVVDTSRLDAKALRMLSREVTTLESVFHPFILRLFEVIETLGKIHLISEWVQGGELYNRIAEDGPLEEYHAAVIFYQLLLAVKHLHNLGYVHRDIKAENVLMVSDDRIKLADFGFSTQLINGPWQHLDTFCGSPPYAAPELFSDDHYIGGPVDIWALGVLVYFMLHAKMPFKASTVPLLRTAVLKGEYEISSTLSLPCCRVIQRILVMAPSRRPTIEQLLKCQWFEYAETFKNVTNKTVNANMDPKAFKQDDRSNEVPMTRRKYFWIFSTSGQRRQYSSSKSPNRKNNSAANENETNEPSLRTIKCCTKRAGSVLEENFLHPIEIELSSTNHLKKSCFSNDSSNNKTYSQKDSNRNRRFSISRLVQKRISPLDFAGKQENSNESTTGDFRDQLQRIIDEEHGKHIMYPTATLNLMHPLEKETRKILESLGITLEMIDKSVINGPRSDIIGIYRIMIHRLQREQTVLKITNGGLNIDQKFDYKRKRNTRRTSSSIHGKDSRQEKRNSNNLTCAIL
uniref:non-specific serine/threonine protein kinase n=1 Tax=Culex tarsalis TaxID=7177 RepID=A0A1Q3FJD3_CULTA